MVQDDFHTLLTKVRGGDAEAAAELVRRYEPSLRRQVRMFLTDPRLRRVVDSMDVCQSVLGIFFLRIAMGQLDLESPAQLHALLKTMAQNRIINYTRDQKAARRDMRRNHPEGTALLERLIDPAAGPGRIAAARELLRQAHELLSGEERDLVQQRLAGRGWNELAQEYGQTAEGLRKRLERTLDRIATNLGLEDETDA